MHQRLVAVFAQIGGYVVFIGVIGSHDHNRTERLHQNARGCYYRNKLLHDDVNDLLKVKKNRGYAEIFTDILIYWLGKKTCCTGAFSKNDPGETGYSANP